MAGRERLRAQDLPAPLQLFARKPCRLEAATPPFSRRRSCWQPDPCPNAGPPEGGFSGLLFVCGLFMQQLSTPWGRSSLYVSAPKQQLFGCVLKRQQPICVQTMGAKATVESVNVGVVRRLAGLGEVECDTTNKAPQLRSRETDLLP
jgi:hypothetical protein